MLQSSFSIPKPCHEDWDTMRPEDRGRHCARCNKVVRDFTTHSPDQILDTLQAAPVGTICGRVQAQHLTPPELPAQVWMRYPITRLRNFLIALIAAFGWSILGISDLDAQSLPTPRPAKIKPIAASPLALRGIVREQYSHDPLQGVQITAIRQGTLGGTAISDSTGHFELPLSPDFLKKGPYDLQLHYFGLLYTEPQVQPDIAELAITVDMSIDLPAIPLTSTIPVSRDPETTTGVVMVVGNIHHVTLAPLDYHPDKYLYRPLDEWLMMHNSEINHTGRH